jgi:hypothetical protein
MIEDSTPGFNVIDELPTDSECRHLHGNDGTGSAGGGCAVRRVACRGAAPRAVTIACFWMRCIITWRAMFGDYDDILDKPATHGTSLRKIQRASRQSPPEHGQQSAITAVGITLV